jgi:hypothetical protein
MYLPAERLSRAQNSRARFFSQRDAVLGSNQWPLPCEDASAFPRTTSLHDQMTSNSRPEGLLRAGICLLPCELLPHNRRDELVIGTLDHPEAGPCLRAYR